MLTVALATVVAVILLEVLRRKPADNAEAPLADRALDVRAAASATDSRCPGIHSTGRHRAR